MEGNSYSYENINSKYILQHIFSLLENCTKFSIIIYNKNIQNKLDIKLEDYKKVSGKYIKKGENGKMKVYDSETNKLIFEGEYKYGKKNGIGKEYDDNGKIIFEGEYYDGKRINGVGYDNFDRPILILNNKIGNEYYKNGGIKFEGEYINDKKWNGKFYDYNGNEIFEIKYGKGYGKEYNYYGELMYDGEYMNGKINGKGKGYWHGKLEYEGEYLDGLRLKGKEYDVFNKSKLIYEGNYIKGKRSKGKEYNKEGKLHYEGEFLDGKYNGLGKVYNCYGNLIYEGEFLDGKKDGPGKEYNETGFLIFEGVFLDGLKWDGYGIEYLNGELKNQCIYNCGICEKYF